MAKSRHPHVENFEFEQLDAAAAPGGMEPDPDAPPAAPLPDPPAPQAPEHLRPATAAAGAGQDVVASSPPPVEKPPLSEPRWKGRALEPYQVGDPGRAALEVVPKLAREPRGRADTVVDACVVGDLEVRAASLRGLSHRHDGITRQDEYCLATSRSEDWLVVGVADGVSAGKLSHVAASIAARQGAMRLAEHLETQPAESIDWTALVDDLSALIVRTGVERLRREGASEADPGATMATTACFAVIGTTPRDDGSFHAHVFALGDSAAWVREGTEAWVRVGGGKDVSEEVASPAVTALPVPPGEASFTSTRVELVDQFPLLVVSDGIGTPMRAGGGPIALFLAEVWETPPDALTFAAQAGFARKTVDDDRTAVAVWPRSVA